MSNRLIKIAKRLGLLALAYVLVLAGTYAYCELAEPPGIRVDQAARPLLSPAQRAALHPDTRAGLEAYEAGDYTRAHALWLPRAEAGDAEAMFRVGRLYDRGEEVTRDLTEARRWYELSADANHPIGSFNYAYMLQTGNGGPKNIRDSVDYYMKSTELGVLDAAFNLGQLFRKGVDVQHDKELSLHWYSIAARKCDTGALVQVGSAYLDGEIVTENTMHMT